MQSNLWNMSRLFLVCLVSSQILQAALPQQNNGNLLHERSLILDVIDKERRPLTSSRQKSLRPMRTDLYTIARNPNEALKTRWAALMLAVEVQPDNAIKELTPFVESKDWFMRNAALIAIQNIDAKKGLEVARQLISDKALVVRSAAVEVLAKSQKSEDRELLWKELSHERNFKGQNSLWIREQILTVLNEKPRPEEIKKFAQLLFDRDGKTQKRVLPTMEKLTSMRFGQTEKSIRSWQQFAKNENLVQLR